MKADGGVLTWGEARYDGDSSMALSFFQDSE